MTGDSRITRHTSELGEWEAVHRAPDPRLAPYVTRLSGWAEHTTFSRRREVPHAGCVLIVNIENRLNVSASGSGHCLNSFHSFFAGLHGGYVVTESNGAGGGIQVDFTPIGAYLFLGIPAHEIADRVVHLEDVLGPDGSRLTAQLEDTPDWATRFDIVEALVLRRLALAPQADESIAWAWSRIEKSQGLVSISKLSERLGWTPRRLIEGFRQEIGLPPKQMARIVRFSRAVNMLSPDEAPALAEIAATCGYYDQAHLSREFREFAGSTPTQYFDRLMPANGGVLDEDPGLGLRSST